MFHHSGNNSVTSPDGCDRRKQIASFCIAAGAGRRWQILRLCLLTSWLLCESQNFGRTCSKRQRPSDYCQKKRQSLAPTSCLFLGI